MNTMAPAIALPREAISKTLEATLTRRIAVRQACSLGKDKVLGCRWTWDFHQTARADLRGQDRVTYVVVDVNMTASC